MTPSLGVLVGLPVAGLFVLIGLVAAVIGVRLRLRNGAWVAPSTVIGRESNYSSREYLEASDVPAWGVLAAGTVVLVVTLVLTGVSMWPWSAEYHEWTPVSGTVNAQGARLLGGDGQSTSQYYAEEINGQTYRCDDTRCSTVKVGDELSLTCKREWQFAGTPGWDCNFESTRPVNGR